MRLTDISAKALQAPPKGAKNHLCDQLDGFGVRVSQAGTEAKRILAERTLGRLRLARLNASEALIRFLGEQRGKIDRSLSRTRKP